jgi:5-deoxy-glucuronate isomerase
VSLHRPAGSLTGDDRSVLLRPADAGWDYSGLEVLELAPDRPVEVRLDGVEAAVVPLTGGCQVRDGDTDVTLSGRPSPVAAQTGRYYTPPGRTLELPVQASAQIAVATAMAQHGGPPRYRSATDVDVAIRGAGRATRQINGLLDAGVTGPERLLVVEVLTPEGNWSSYPPHKHDEERPGEVINEEIYYFELAGGPQAFAFHRLYTTDGDIDATETVRHGDVFLIPRGYHGPSVAAPGYELYYLNVLAGPGPKRSMAFCNDPEHEWVRNGWSVQEPDPRAPLTTAGGRRAPFPVGTGTSR